MKNLNEPNYGAGIALSVMLAIISFMTSMLMKGIWIMEPVTRSSAGGAVICGFMLIFGIILLYKKAASWNISSGKAILLILPVIGSVVYALHPEVMLAETNITQAMPDPAILFFLIIHAIFYWMILTVANTLGTEKTETFRSYNLGTW